jgi:hypothetical protein
VLRACRFELAGHQGVHPRIGFLRQPGDRHAPPR